MVKLETEIIRETIDITVPAHSSRTYIRSFYTTNHSYSNNWSFIGWRVIWCGDTCIIQVTSTTSTAESTFRLYNNSASQQKYTEFVAIFIYLKQL